MQNLEKMLLSTSCELTSPMISPSAVFLPAAGVRKMDNINPTPSGLVTVIEQYQVEGWYWTSTQSAMPKYAVTFAFNEAENVNLSMEEHEYGCSVRLVRDAQ